MRLLKKYLFSAALLLAPSISFAQITINNPLGAQSDISDIIFDLTVFAWEVSFPLITLGALVAGFLFITSGGDPEGIKRAKANGRRTLQARDL